jgi:hypothetical protein
VLTLSLTLNLVYYARQPKARQPKARQDNTAQLKVGLIHEKKNFFGNNFDWLNFSKYTR